jgi:hypothetical protein
MFFIGLGVEIWYKDKFIFVLILTFVDTVGRVLVFNQFLIGIGGGETQAD